MDAGLRLIAEPDPDDVHIEMALVVVPHDLDRLAREVEWLAEEGAGVVTWAPAAL
jgi:hypothetical protein